MSDLSCKIIIGDSRDMSEIDDGEVNLIVTSPPYYTARGSEDYENVDEWLSDMMKVFKECERVLQEGRIMCVNISDYIRGEHRYPLIALMSVELFKSGWEYQSELIWLKPDGYQSPSARRASNFIRYKNPLYTRLNCMTEAILIYRKGMKPDYENLNTDPIYTREEILEMVRDGYLRDVWKFATDTSGDHFLSFPYEMPKRLIKIFSLPGEVVLDPFLGSGTTAKAALDLDRCAIGIERVKSNIKLIKKKIGFGQMKLDKRIRYDITIRPDSKEDYDHV